MTNRRKTIKAEKNKTVIYKKSTVKKKVKVKS